MHIAASASYEKLVDRQLGVVEAYAREHGVLFPEAMNATNTETDKMRREWAASTPWRD